MAARSFSLLRPQLATERDFLAHPAFSLLRIETEQSAQRVLFHRRGGSQAHPDLSCKWTGPDIRSFIGVKAVALQSELGLPEAEPSLLLELPLQAGEEKPRGWKCSWPLGKRRAAIARR